VKFSQNESQLLDQLSQNKMLTNENTQLKKLMKEIQTDFTQKISETIQRMTTDFNQERLKFKDKLAELKTEIQLITSQKADFKSKWVQNTKSIEEERQKYEIFKRESEKL
jgi:hypothetical protein